MEKELINCKIGDIVRFGEYYEPIEWLVLDRQNNHILMITRYGIKNIPFRSGHGKVTWENSELRRWLNNEFYNESFNEKEKRMISISDVPAEKNPTKDSDPGNSTEDMIFALSISEAIEYLSFEQRICSGIKRENNSSAYSLEENVLWWLRTSGSTNLFACIAGLESFGYKSESEAYCDGLFSGIGEINGKYYPTINHGGRGGGSQQYARPAMWINTDS